MGNDDKQQIKHEQYQELQVLLRNLGIVTKQPPLDEIEKKRAHQAFPD